MHKHLVFFTISLLTLNLLYCLFCSHVKSNLRSVFFFLIKYCIDVNPGQGFYLLWQLVILSSIFLLIGRILNNRHIDIALLNFTQIKDAIFAIRDLNILPLIQFQSYANLLLGLPTGTLQGSFSLIDFSFRNAIHSSWFMSFNQKYFRLIHIKHNNSVNRSKWISIVNDFCDFKCIVFFLQKWR